jgi:hypothetical protein
MKELRRKIKQDEKYIRFNSVIEMNKTRINVSSIMDEIRDIAEIRTKSSLKYNMDGSMLASLMKENLNAQSYRSRLSEVCVTCSRITAKIDTACEKLSSYLNVRFNVEIQGLGRTKDERGAVVKLLLQDAYEFMNGMAAIVEMAETVIADIDKQHYSLKLTLDAMNLHVNKEHIF